MMRMSANPRRIYSHDTALTPRASRQTAQALRRIRAPEQATGRAQASVAAQAIAEPKAYAWRARWWPVALLEDLDIGRPTPLTLLGTEMALWRDPQAHWHAFGDACPHRLAPLSEGRIDEDGHLSCNYHGWAFDASGACVGIPQADPKRPIEARATSHARTRATAYPAEARDGMLWVWPDLATVERAIAPWESHLPGAFHAPDYLVTRIARDFDIDYAALMENVSDPAHIHFAHHNVTGKRQRAAPIPYARIAVSEAGFAARVQAGASEFADSRFLAPMATINMVTPSFPETMQRVGRALGLFAAGPSELHIGSYVIPTSPGHCRIITHATRNFMKIRLPRWWSHARENKVFEGDAVMLYKQQHFLDNSRLYRRQTMCPTASDRAVLAFRQWLERYGNHGPWGAAQLPRDANPRSARELLERKAHHTDICGACRGAYDNVMRGRVWAQGVGHASMAVAVCAAAARQTPLAMACVSVALISAAVGQRLDALRQSLEGYERYDTTP